MTLTTKEIDKTILFSFLYRTKYILSFYANEYSIHSWYDILRSKTLVERVNDTIRLTFLTGVRRCTKILAENSRNDADPLVWWKLRLHLYLRRHARKQKERRKQRWKNGSGVFILRQSHWKGATVTLLNGWIKRQQNGQRKRNTRFREWNITLPEEIRPFLWLTLLARIIYHWILIMFYV